jgi:fibronectin-binding autotransporter adhesin
MMKTRKRKGLWAGASLLGACLLLAPGASPQAAALRWTGQGVTALWSDTANWDAEQVPGNGADVQFAGAPPRRENVLDLNRSFASVVFATDAQAFSLHVQGSGAVLTLDGSGPGIRNLTIATGAIQQHIYADAGIAGGSIVFTGSSGINVGGGAAFQPVNLTARGAATGTAFGGRIVFQDNASAGARTADQLRADGAAAVGGVSGAITFQDRARAGQATLTNAPAQVSGALGGSTRFSGQAVGGNATITNAASLSAGGGAGGRTIFSEDAHAQNASIDNQGGFLTTDNASTGFLERASAGQAFIVNRGGRAAGAFGGGTFFDGMATAGAATLVMAGGDTHAALGGFAAFYADANAGSAVVDVRAASVLGAVGGRALFVDRASAGTARFTVAGSPLDHVLGAEGGAVSFAGASSAGDANFTVGGNAYAGGGVGALRFTDRSTAARATVTLAAGQSRGGALSFEGASLADLASAGSARITNQGASSGAAHGLSIGGQTTFVANSTAGSASITNQAGFGSGRTFFFAASGAGTAGVNNLGGLVGQDGGSTQFNNTSDAQDAVIFNAYGARGANGFDAAGSTRFVDQANAGRAIITAAGATSVSTIGGLISFSGNAQPANATLVAEGGSNAGAGGRIQLSGLTNASQARVILNAGAGSSGGGELDVSAMGTPRVAIGSVEGGGIVNLGSKNLTVWSNTANTTFSGLLRDGGFNGGSGGSLTVTGGAALTLTGANTYSGGTRIGDGIHAGSGRLVAANTEGSATGIDDVVVDRGGTLAGNGYINGPAYLMEGGLVAPGDQDTLTLADDLV